MGELHFCLLCHPCTALDQASSLSRKLAYLPGPTFGFVKLLASSGSHCTKWADEQHRHAGFESGLVPDLPLPFIPTIIGLKAFDLVSSRVWWEAATNTWHTCPDPHLGSWNCLPHQAHIALSELLSCTDKQGSSLGSFPTSPPLYPHFNRPSGFWPCVKSCLVGGSDKYSGPVLDFGPERGPGKGTMADLGPLIRHLVSTRLPSGGWAAFLSPLFPMYGTRPCV